MKVERELKMTVICHAPCDNQYGAWRQHCPVCGHETPKGAHDNALRTSPTFDKNNTRGASTRAVRTFVHRVTRVREAHPTACVFCHRRGARERCAHCNEMIHHNCQGIHGSACAQFQVDRQAEIARLA